LTKKGGELLKAEGLALFKKRDSPVDASLAGQNYIITVNSKLNLISGIRNKRKLSLTEKNKKNLYQPQRAVFGVIKKSET